MRPLIVIDTVALPLRHLHLAPRLHALARAGWHAPMRESLPAVTCTAQASMLTGQQPQRHGIVGNGWLFKDTMEIRFWQQSNRLLEAEPIYATLRKAAQARGKTFRCAKLFWWFNQGADVDISVTPKPHYGADGNKAFDILTNPPALTASLQKKLGPFPFPTFWGPMAGLPCSEWIGRCAAEIVSSERPDLTLVYLPHLDYDTQRLGPAGCNWKKLAGELDDACAPIFDAAKAIGARVWVVNEYTHVPVNVAILLNRALRERELLSVRKGPFGEQLDLYASRAFAVCDHQLAHIYVRDAADRERVKDLLVGVPGVDRTYVGEQRSEIGLDHSRAGDIIALSRADAWFAYPFWLDDHHAPDYARTVDIHRKPGYDPCELFFDPALPFPKGRAMRRLLQKKLGFRTLFDVVPLDPSLVKGSHGLLSRNADNAPVFVGDGNPRLQMAQTDLASMVDEAMTADA